MLTADYYLFQFFSCFIHLDYLLVFFMQKVIDLIHDLMNEIFFTSILFIVLCKLQGQITKNHHKLYHQDFDMVFNFKRNSW
jgi:hypothetical protein